MNARDITSALGGQWFGSYGMALCVSHDDGREPALKISDSPVIDDGISLHCFGGCDFRNVKAELRRRGLIPGRGAAAPIDNAEQARIKTERDQRRTRTRDYINRLWFQCQPAAGSIVENYLRHSRGLSFDGMPVALRYHRALRHMPTGLDLPTMVALVADEMGRPAGLHRTFLKADGSDKAAVSQNKMMLGECRGGAVRLFPVAEQLGVAEGLETSFAAAQLFGMPVWATLSTSGMRGVMLPPEICDVVIFADYDAIDPKTGKRPGSAAAESLAVRLRAERRRVHIEYPDAGCKDFADLLVGRRAA